jgi:hypothetical protein
LGEANERPEAGRTISRSGRTISSDGNQPLSALGLEPRTYGLKVRCSTN